MKLGFERTFGLHCDDFGSILGSLLAPSLLQLPGICPAQPDAASGNGVRDAVRGLYSRAVAKSTEVKQTPSKYDWLPAAKHALAASQQILSAILVDPAAGPKSVPSWLPADDHPKHRPQVTDLSNLEN